MHTMKAVVFRGINDLRLVEVPMFSRQGDGVVKVALFSAAVPDPTPAEIRTEVLADLASERHTTCDGFTRWC